MKNGYLTEVIKISFNEFVKGLQKELSENGVRISQDKIKIIFEVMGQYIMDNIKYEEHIPIREFLLFDLVLIEPKKLPDGTMSKEHYSMKIRMSNNYKKKLKETLNK